MRMIYQRRIIETTITSVLERGKSLLLLGPRQTGKTTMLETFKPDMSVTLAHTDERRHGNHPRRTDEAWRNPRLVDRRSSVKRGETV